MTRARDLARIANSNALTIDSSGNVGIGSTVPTSKLSVVGIVSASQVFASGVNLANVASGNITPTSVVISDEGATAVTINSSGINITGVITATSFYGNATGLSGSPNITVGNIVGAALTLSGNLTVNGTQTIINTTNLEITDPLVGIGSGNTTDAQADGDGILIYGTTNKTLTYNNTKKAFETNVAWAPNETRIITGAEKIHRQSGNTVTLTYNSSSSSNVGYTTNPSGDVTVNVVGIPTSSDFDDHSISFTVITRSTGTARTCTVVTLNGVTETIRWAGGSLSGALSGVTTTTGHAIFSFTGINTIGSASTTANYELFGIVSGGFF